MIIKAIFSCGRDYAQYAEPTKKVEVKINEMESAKNHSNNDITQFNLFLLQNVYRE